MSSVAVHQNTTMSINENDLDSAYCTLHNLGAHMLGNTQASDIDWFASVLFENSRLGAGDVKTVDWLLDRGELDYLNLEAIALLSNGPVKFDLLTSEQQEAWRKLARICLYVLPMFADRVGHRYLEQAKMLRQIWKQARVVTDDGC